MADGPSDKAFGIHVAEAARFPASVVHTAKRKLAELEESELLPAKARAGSTAEAGAAVEPSVGTGGEQARTRPAVSEEERAEGLSQVELGLELGLGLAEGLSQVELGLELGLGLAEGLSQVELG